MPITKFFSWVRDNRDRETDDLMQQIDHSFINVRG